MFGCGAGSKVGVMKHDRGKAEGVRAKPLYRYYTPGVKRRQQSGCPSDFCVCAYAPLELRVGVGGNIDFLYQLPQQLLYLFGLHPKGKTVRKPSHSAALERTPSNSKIHPNLQLRSDAW